MLYLARWAFLAFLGGLTASLSVALFQYLLMSISGYLLSVPKVPLPVWTIIGAAFTGGVLYRFQPDAAGEGIPSYIQSMHLYHGRFPFPVTLFKFFSGLVTLSTFGNGGIVGPVGRFCAGLMSGIVHRLRFLKFIEDDVRTASICGLAGAVGAIFHSPLGGGVFAVEIIQRAKMGYKDLFPAILSSITAVIVCRTLGFQPFYRFDSLTEWMEPEGIGWIAVFALLTGIVGWLYTKLYSLVSRLIKRNQGNVLLKVLLGSAAAAWLAWFVEPSLLGTSSSLFFRVFEGFVFDELRLFALLPLWAGLLLLMAVKGVCNCVTVGSGMSAGFAGPSILIGTLFGAAFAAVIGVPPGTPEYYGFLAAGFAGILAGTMNVPIAATLLAAEVFGISYSLPAGFAAIMAFQMNRHVTLYDYALAGAGERVDY